MKNLFFLTLVTFISLSRSAISGEKDLVNCAPKEEKSLKILESDLIQKIETLKHCPTDDENILKQVTSEFHQNFELDKAEIQNVHGFKLQGSPKEIKIVNEMLGVKPPKGWSDAAKSCTSVQCALTKLLNSKLAAMQILNFKIKTGYVLSLDQTINQNRADQIWAPKEIQELDAAASKFPAELKNLKLAKIDRVADDFRLNGDKENVAAFADRIPELVIYDVGAKGNPVSPNSYQSTSWPQETLTHELCHHHDFKDFYTKGTMGSEQKNSIYGKLSGWNEVTDAKGKISWKRGPNAKFVSSYAETSPAEDYAETCMNYILHPETLENKAPEKYNFMKNNVFHNQEFKEKSWATSKSKSWPKLHEQIADESFCGQVLATCLANLKYEYDMFCDVVDQTEDFSTSTCGSEPLSVIQRNNCVMLMKKNRISEIQKILVNEDNFCENGGAGVIEQEVNNVCAHSVNDFAHSLEAAVAIDMKSAVAACESENDFTNGCVVSKGAPALKSKGDYNNIVDKILRDKIPDRVNALVSLFEQKSDNLWLKSCLNSVKTISVFDSTDSTGKKSMIFNYYPMDSKIQSAFLGKFIYDDYKHNDVNQACAKNIIEALKTDSVKVPESGSPVNLMKGLFISELHSLEDEVLGKINGVTKKCLVSKKCKSMAIFELLKEWESRSPKQRAGFATEEYAQELVEKWEN